MIANFKDATRHKAPVVRLTDCPNCDGAMYIDVPHPDPALAARSVTVMQACPVCNGDELPTCTVCEDKGFISIPIASLTPPFSKLIPCPTNCAAVQQQQAERLTRLTRYSQLSKDYAGCTFDRFDAMPDAFKRGKLDARRAAGLFVEAAPQQHMIQSNWINGALGSIAPDEQRNWLLLFGAHGMGKTGMAASIVNALAAVGIPCLYIRLDDALQAIQRRYKEAWAEYGERDDFEMLSSSGVLDDIKKAPVLVVDEWFVSERPRETPDHRQKLETIMRYRSGERLPTVITTNYAYDVLETAWGTTTLSVVKARSFAIPLTGLELRPGAVVAPAEKV